MSRLSILLIFSLLTWVNAVPQIVINEASNRNLTQLADSAGDYPDWVELYNTGSQPVNLYRYHLSDDPDNLLKWTFPNVTIGARQWLVVFAAGEKEKYSPVEHWETAVYENDIWKWTNPDQETSSEWYRPGFDDQAWASGKGGFGFGDGDDRTEFSRLKSAVYTRIRFSVSDTSKIIACVLHVDYDDGFVAWLNGVEIARANMDGRPAWNTLANASREAVMIIGKMPDPFFIDIEKVKSVLKEGENILAVECHNNLANSPDMTLRTFLSFGLSDASRQFGPTPSWFSLNESSELRASFKIARKGEPVCLSDPDGRLIDRIDFPGWMPVDYSVGRITDGTGTLGIFEFGTPKRSNRYRLAYTKGFEGPAEVLPGGGFYDRSVTVIMAASDPKAIIRYTLDGQTPVETSPVYQTPLMLNKTAVVKARVFSPEGKLPGPVSTRSYFIDNNPTPAGVLSLTVDEKDLFGEQGIYDNYWTDYKKPCFMEYFAPGTHQPAFAGNAAIRIDGGAGGSRSHPQRSFRVEPGHSTLGDGDLKYPLIPVRKDRESYATFYLRNGSNQYLFYPCKDAIETRCMGEGTHNVYAGYTPVQVWLNGQYWGFYELREKLDLDYLVQHEGSDPDSLDILSVSYYYGGTLREVEGEDPIGQFNTDYSRFLSLDPKSEDFWDQASRIFDLENYTDYICAQSWMADVDWPYNNIRMYRSPETGQRWRFMLIDLELSLEPNGWQNSSFDHIDYMRNYDPNMPYIHLWQRAMENKRYHDYFINRYADLMNTSWSRQKLLDIANEIYSATRPELPATYVRWGDPNKPVSEYMQEFDQAHLTMLNELAARSVNVRNHIKSNYKLPNTYSITLRVLPAGSGSIRISTVTPESYPWTGIYFGGVPVRIEALPAPGYKFDRWETMSLVQDVTNPVWMDTLSRAATFTATFTPGDFSSDVIISELNYNSGSGWNTDDWIELYNADTIRPANLNGWYLTDEDSTHVYRFPPTCEIQPGGFLVLARSADSFKSFFPGIDMISGLNFGFSGGGDQVKLYNPEGQLIEGFTYETQFPWPEGADGKGFTLERILPPADPSKPSSWTSGCPGGSPGQAYHPCQSGREDLSNANLSLSVYPNPFSEQFTVYLNDAHPFELNVYNSLGQRIINETFVGSETRIDMSGQHEGVYLISIKLEDGSQMHTKLIKR
jgi:hypothetical protein